MAFVVLSVHLGTYAPSKSDVSRELALPILPVSTAHPQGTIRTWYIVAMGGYDEEGEKFNTRQQQHHP